jgi:sialidase-1
LLWPEGPDLSKRSSIYIWSSKDGIEWNGGRKTGATGIVPGRVTETEDGNWVLGTHDVCPETGKLRQLLWKLMGESKWSPTVVGEDPDLNLCEGSFVKRGREVACIMRENSGTGLPGFKAVSGDSGKTWGEVMPTGLLGCHRPVAGWWEGKILVTYRCYAGGGVKNTLFMGALIEPEGLFEPCGKTTGRIFPIDYDRNPKPDTGYSGWCELPDGDILVAYYIKDDAPKAQIRCCRFSREDLELSQ